MAGAAGFRGAGAGRAGFLGGRRRNVTGRRLAGVSTAAALLRRVVGRAIAARPVLIEGRLAVHHRAGERQAAGGGEIGNEGEGGGEPSSKGSPGGFRTWRG